MAWSFLLMILTSLLSASGSQWLSHTPCQPPPPINSFCSQLSSNISFVIPSCVKQTARRKNCTTRNPSPLKSLLKTCPSGDLRRHCPKQLLNSILIFSLQQGVFSSPINQHFFSCIASCHYTLFALWVENMASHNCLHLAKFSRDQIPCEIITGLCHTQEKIFGKWEITYSFVQNSSYKMENIAAGSEAKSCRSSTQRLSDCAGQPIENTGARTWTHCLDLQSSNEEGGKKINVCLSTGQGCQERWEGKRSFTLITDNEVLECRKHPQEGESGNHEDKKHCSHNLRLWSHLSLD